MCEYEVNWLTNEKVTAFKPYLSIKLYSVGATEDKPRTDLLNWC